MAEGKTTPILVTAMNEGPGMDPAAFRLACEKSGRSALSLGFDILKMARSRQRVRPMEYLSYGLWRRDLSAEARADYISLALVKKINSRLASPDPDRQVTLMVDKHLTALVLAGIGVTVPVSRAIYSPEVAYGALPRLTTPEALVAYMTAPENLPFFGKPVNGSRALGSISVVAVSDDRASVTLGDGKVVNARQLAQEVARNFPRGWLIQDLVQNAPAVRDRAGPALAALRFVTLWGEGGPAPFYALWRIPALGAMTDGVISGANILADVDLETGRVGRAQFGDQLKGQLVTHSMVDPALDLTGFVMPHWDRVVQTCVEAHRAFPGHGLLGWDVGVTADGPLITEINTNPLHTLYQRVLDEGFLNPARKARLDAAEAALKARMARFAKQAAPK